MNDFASSSLASIRRNQLHLEAKHHRLAAEATRGADRHHLANDARKPGPRRTLRLTIDNLLSRASA